ncbi:MAG: hypothetical protein K6G40_09005 [Eubacterium sp.]|nr:hypothetical protein [Eubacterium sp.]
MEDLKQQQKEALLTVQDYVQRLKKAIPNACGELRGDMLDDTEEYVKTILNGVNYTIEVLRRTLDYINADEDIIDKEEVNGLITDFMDVYRVGPNEKIADAFEKDILVYLEKLDTAISKTCA